MEIKITPTAEPKGRRKHQDKIDKYRSCAAVFGDPAGMLLREAADTLESLSPPAEPEKVVMTVGDIRSGQSYPGIWKINRDSLKGNAGLFEVGPNPNEHGYRRLVIWLDTRYPVGTGCDHEKATYLGPIASIEIEYTPHTGGTDAK